MPYNFRPSFIGERDYRAPEATMLAEELPHYVSYQIMHRESMNESYMLEFKKILKNKAMPGAC